MRELEKCSILLEGVEGVKVSFEDEGATLEEVFRLKSICGKVPLFLKIGGPEAIRDIKDSMLVGVNGLVAPMVESPFGLKKFVDAVDAYVPEDIKDELGLYVNIETVTAVENIKAILHTNEARRLSGVTVGRADLSSSQGKGRDFVNSNEILLQSQRVFEEARNIGLKTCLGGTVSIESQGFLEILYSQGLLDKFETRYIMFDPKMALNNLSDVLNEAIEFELIWLKSKQVKSNADVLNAKRIEMIERRLNANKVEG